MKHGTTGGYVRGCRCQDCRNAQSAYSFAYWHAKPSLKVSSDRVRAHIEKLAEFGLGAKAIADCCGVGPATVRLIRQGRKLKVYRRTEQRILSVTPEGIADAALVDASVSRTLLSELLQEGWTRRDLMAALGRKGKALHILHLSRVQAKTQLRVEKLYRRAMRDGVSAIPAQRSAA